VVVEGAREPSTGGDSRTTPPVERTAHVLVVANETVGGQKLLEAIERRRQRGPLRCTVVCPQNKPRRGYVIYDDSVRSAARIRLDFTLDRLREMGIDADGEVMDPDPFLAVQDALRIYRPDEIIISTYPYARSGWLRRDLVDRIRSYSKLPVEHVIVDLIAEPTKHALVVANETVGGRHLIESLERRASESPHHFTVISPQGDKGPEAVALAQERLDQTLKELRLAGLDVVGQMMDPDPFTSIMNALQYLPADEIIISTFPGEKSGWLRTDLIGRVRRATGKSVEHLTAEPASEPEAATVQAAGG
jgi:hypothetical protein